MDGLKFDTLVKSLRPAFGRRRALAATLGGLLVSLPSLSHPGAAKRRGKRRRKKAKAQRSRAEAKPLYSKEECDALCQGIPQQQSAWAKCKKACRNGHLEACQGDPDRLCMAAHGDSAFSFTCCGPADEQTCENGQCVDSGCIPDNAAACAGKNCGEVENNCGETVPCGNNICPPNQICGGGGTPNVCGCTPDNAAACAGRSCGLAINNCGIGVPCGSCGPGQICQNGQCVAIACSANCPPTHFCCQTTFAPTGICCVNGQTCNPNQGCPPS